MPSQDWLAYVNSIGGLVGAVAGIGGLVVSVMAFHRTGQFKAMGLRLELHRGEASVRTLAANIVQIMKGARASYLQACAARGYGPGSNDHWLAEWSSDMKNAEALVQRVAAQAPAAGKMSRVGLEVRLNAVQDLQHQLSRLAAKYSVTSS